MKQSLLRLTASAVIFLIIVILAVGCTGERVENTTGGDGLSIELNNSQTQIAITPSPTTNPLAELPAYLFATPKPFETLPSYPIPSPTFIATPEPGETGPDTSAVVRIVIPALGVDAEVAYVPFDGQSWLIQGLREEVAWMGNTSWPGLGGNTALAGHVTVAGLGDGPFRYLIDLKQGDEIILYTERNAYTYRVRERVVVAETDMWVTEPSETAQITLITCVDWNERIEMYLKRLVVFADQISVQAMAQY
jgi:LPXTG-site transpeptidase (sortase) family protein